MMCSTAAWEYTSPGTRGFGGTRRKWKYQQYALLQDGKYSTQTLPKNLLITEMKEKNSRQNNKK
jgi:hypothetical protein